MSVLNVGFNAVIYFFLFSFSWTMEKVFEELQATESKVSLAVDLFSSIFYVSVCKF